MTPAAPCPRRARRGFTLVELIVVFVVGALLATLVTTMAQQHMPHFGNETAIQVDRQYDLLREIERLQAAYRQQLEAGTLNLNTLLAGWTPESGAVTLAVEAHTVSDTGGTFTFSTPLRKVRFTCGDYVMYAYFAQ